MKRKDKVIIYGLGRAYEENRYFLHRNFEILAYADGDEEKARSGGAIRPGEIRNYPYDYIYITSRKYAEEIRAELAEGYGIDRGKTRTEEDMWWRVPNDGVRSEWIIRKLGEIPGGLTLLDAGAGNRPYREYCGHLKYISQDFGEYDTSTCGAGIQIEGWRSRESDIISDITSIPVGDACIDVVLCSEVFEHVRNPVAALQELSRIIKDGGTLLLTAPFCSLTHMAPYYYASGFSRYWYEDHLREAGFEIRETVPNGNWFTYMMQELGRLPDMAERYGAGMDREAMGPLWDMLDVLERQRREDRGSDELLCFGYMVRAVKRRGAE